MRKEVTLIFLFLGIICSSCKSKTKNEANEITVLDKAKKEIKVDASLIKIADLPIHIDSTNYLIHPVGYGNNKEVNKSYFSSSKGGETYHLTGFYDNEINGMMINLKFQKLGSDKFTSLTKENIQISSVSFLREIFNVTKQQILMYKVIDSDTNDDKKLGYEDDISLYLSKIDGTNFIKISPQKQKVINVKELAENKRLYFKTTESIKSEEDKLQIHYFYVDLTNKNFNAIEYYPIND
ncbi:hypothetical protein C7448_10265 [Tenacibaculum gallaicum]|uniref:Uncharacterized protein n=1 Tax=Tenacibaculum gallaicum TaxID=561505 RepID=A0A3E0I8S9_9FLAO|nr:hypothetical protein [Tenacibaculum gallaicum]REH54545.1 hypothetical protein C7448_10265 [Tenacibaculum gallaicum]